MTFMEPDVPQQSYRLRVDIAIIPCSDEHGNGAAAPVRRCADMTLPLDQVVIEGKIVGETVRMIGSMAMQVYQSAAIGLIEQGHSPAILRLSPNTREALGVGRIP